MAARKRQPIEHSRAAGSWMAILASTTLGVDTAAKTVQAEVRLQRADLDEDREYRLVVQSYDGDARPGSGARPVGSVQRAVTAAELRDGIKIDLLELRTASLADPATKPTVVAWVEVGKPDLEFDGRMARPLPGSVFGMARANDGTATITLNKRAA